jgi:thiamine biosynthesis protein ThiC
MEVGNEVGTLRFCECMWEADVHVVVEGELHVSLRMVSGTVAYVHTYCSVHRLALQQ